MLFWAKFPLMRREWQPEELIASWTLVDRDWELVANKSGATRLGFALLLKFFELEGRFPVHAGELPPAAVQYVASQVKVSSGLLVQYVWSGRTIEYHRAQIRDASHFREPTRADEQRLACWLADEVCPGELSEERERTRAAGALPGGASGAAWADRPAVGQGTTARR